MYMLSWLKGSFVWLGSYFPLFFFPEKEAPVTYYLMCSAEFNRSICKKATFGRSGSFVLGCVPKQEARLLLASGLGMGGMGKGMMPMGKGAMQMPMPMVTPLLWGGAKSAFENPFGMA